MSERKYLPKEVPSFLTFCIFNSFILRECLFLCSGLFGLGKCILLSGIQTPLHCPTNRFQLCSQFGEIFTGFEGGEADNRGMD